MKQSFLPTLNLLGVDVLRTAGKKMVLSTYTPKSGDYEESEATLKICCIVFHGQLMTL